MAFTLAALPYAHDALEPHIDTLTMQIHHGKHHQAYVDNLNKAVAGTEHENKSLEELVASAGKISPAVRNNGGGHWNHTFFWESLEENAGGLPSGPLAEAIRVRVHRIGQDASRRPTTTGLALDSHHEIAISLVVFATGAFGASRGLFFLGTNP